ncbi:MAG: ribosome small subunit-dependent GTPase A [Treponema sp.]|jgi:ribosome biogenesis GTPase|nr:ribosome small subunit-dependent GTPase A [Treponema sp.]
MSGQSGVVLSGSRNIITVRPDQADGTDIQCRIKGKILKGTEGFYNPLAPGDRVQFEIDPGHPGTAMIIAVEDRKNLFSRFNQKGSQTQLLAANIDQVLCMTTRSSPPFRPRFLDRVLLQADIADIPAVIVCNKIDLDGEDGCEDRLDADERLEDFRRIGFEVCEVSAKTGEGLDDLRERIGGKRSVLTGQSGVGKSSLINALLPGLDIKTGAINEKYDRGNHTTTLASVVEIDDVTWLIDTPGIRRFVPDDIGPDDIILHMGEFASLAGKCSYGLSCSHRIEPGCKIMEAVAAGIIHEDRYTSFLRIHDELSGKNHVD